MMKTNLTLILYITITLLFPQKTSQEIEKNIDRKSKESEQVKLEIEQLAKKIKKKEIESNSSSKKLATIHEKIELTEELLRLLKKENYVLSSSINIIEANINEKNTELKQIKKKFSKMVQHLYKNKSDNYLDILLNSEKWSDLIYKAKYLEIISNEHEKIKIEINAIVSELDQEIESLTNQLLDRKINQSDKKNIIYALQEDGDEEEKILGKIKSEKFNLEKKKVKKKSFLLQIEKMIEKLYIDKDSAKKREKKLEEIRQERKNRETKNTLELVKFSSLKGKLPWPVEGKITSNFGKVENDDGVSSNNIWIEIKTTTNAQVKSVHDGIVLNIDFHPVYNGYVYIDHGGGYTTVYGNLDDENIMVKEQEYIKAETIIGNTLNTEDERNSGKLFFMIFDKEKNPEVQNPEDWIK